MFNYQLATREVHGWLVLRLIYFAFTESVSLCVHTYHVCNKYVMYTVAMQPYLSRLRQFRQPLCVATISVVQHSYEFKMDRY